MYGIYDGLPELRSATLRVSSVRWQSSPQRSTGRILRLFSAYQILISFKIISLIISSLLSYLYVGLNYLKILPLVCLNKVKKTGFALRITEISAVDKVAP